MKFRKAEIKDVGQIHALINYYAQKDQMLPRSLNEIYEGLRDFHVAEDKGEVIGCAALHVVWEELAEIKSVAVKEDYGGRGIGKDLVARCIEDAKTLGITRVFVLTYIPAYFQKFGFKRISKDTLPHKVWNECVRCPKFPSCGEEALLLDL